MARRRICQEDLMARPEPRSGASLQQLAALIDWAEIDRQLDTFFCHWAAGGQRGVVRLADLASVRGLRGGSHMRRSDAREGPISQAASP
jgi:hypothetical protein